MERARRAGEKVMGHLAEGNSREAWRTLSGWYRAVEGKAAKPCYHRMEAQTVEREALYDYVPPPGRRYPRTSTARARTMGQRATLSYRRR